MAEQNDPRTTGPAPEASSPPILATSGSEGLQRVAANEFQLLVESVMDYAIFLLDTKGNITTWNKGAHRIKGYTATEIIGKHFSVFYTPEDIARNHPQEELEIALKEGRYEEEGWRVRKDDSLFRARVTITALLDENGDHRGFAKVTRDITERERALENLLGRHRAEEQFTLLVESVLDYAIFLLDTKGNITTWNRGAHRIKGYTAAEIIGKHFSVFYTPEDIARNHPQEELEIALKEGRYEEEGWRVRKDGSRFLADVIITALFDEKGIHRGFAKVTRDITDRKRAEEERLQRAQEASSRVFLREILYSVTEGRLRFCEDLADLPAKLHARTGELPVMKSSLSSVRAAVNKAANGINFPTDRSQDLITAVSEAAMNAAVHASTASCQVCAAGDDQSGVMQVWVSDKGTGIAITHLHRATLERGFTTGGTLGHGFWMMLNTCDRIWLWTGPSGTTVVLEQDAAAPEPQWMRSQAYAGI